LTPTLLRRRRDGTRILREMRGVRVVAGRWSLVAGRWSLVAGRKDGRETRWVKRSQPWSEPAL